MRLGIIVTNFPRTTETFIYRDVMEFSRRGHEVRLYHLTARTEETVHGFAAPILDWTRSLPYLLSGKVVGAVARASVRKPARLLRLLGEMIWAFRADPDTLAKSLLLVPKCLAYAEELEAWPADHVRGEFATYPGTCAWIVGRMTGLPYSVSCRAHDIFITQALLDRKLGEAAFVRTISEYKVRFLRQRVPALRDSEFQVVHSSLDTAAVNALDPAGPPPPFRVLYVGSLEVRKGVDHLLQALARAGPALGDWRAELVGGGPERDRLVALAESLQIADRVAFCGPRPFEEVSRAYGRAHVVVAPSIVGPGGRTEGIPNVVIETLAHQRPVISTRVSGIPELVVDGETGYLVEAGDIAALAAALRAIHDDPGEAHARARRGRLKVEAEFDLVANASRQLELFAKHAR